MKRFEYRLEKMEVKKSSLWKPELIALLNQHGSEGWRLITPLELEPKSIYTDEGERENLLVINLLFERQLNNDK